MATKVPANYYAVDFEKFFLAIRDAAEKTLSQQQGVMYRMAVARVPVRKLYSMGRRHKRLRTRKLSVEELMAEKNAFLSTVSPQRRAALSSDAAYLKARTGTRTTTTLNTTSKWRKGSGRQAVWTKPWRIERGRYEQLQKPAPVQFKLKGSTPARERVLRGRMLSRARYDWDHAKIQQVGIHPDFRDRGRGAFYFNRATGTWHFGGNLRASITTHEDTDLTFPKVFVTAGGERAPYARYVEFGTRKMAARPFMRPAFQHVRMTFLERLKGSIRSVEHRKPNYTARRRNGAY